MSWVCDQHNILLHFTIGLSSNALLSKSIDKELRKWRNSYEKHKQPVCYYYSFWYKVKSLGHKQCVITKIKANSMGENVRFIVMSNHSNKPKTFYRHYFGKGETKLWIKDLESICGDRMSYGSFRANQFILFFMPPMSFSTILNIRRLKTLKSSRSRQILLSSGSCSAQ
jgi:hypothetical protein